MQIGRPGVDLPLSGGGDACVALLLAFPDGGRLDRYAGAEQGRDDLGLAERLLSPGPGDQVLRAFSLLQEVHRDLGEQRRGAPLDQKHLVSRRYAEKLANEGDGLVVYRLVLLSPVAVLHHRHAAAGEIEQFLPGALERGEGKGCGSGVEVDRSAHDLPLFLGAQGIFAGRASIPAAGRSLRACIDQAS